jgi:hemerythrin
MAMIWSDNFSVGVSSIDEQHKELFHRTNRLLEACQEGRGKEVVKPSIFWENMSVPIFHMRKD